MQKIKITYNPYKMKTEILVNGINVCKTDAYLQFREFIETNTPLQTWAEPIPYKNWKGVINELASEDCYDEIEIVFNGRKIDYEDLKRACESANEKRKEKLDITYALEQEYSDEQLVKGIDRVMKSLLSEKFAKIVDECGEYSQIAKDYKNLPMEYERAKNKEFKIVFAGLYSSGKSTILNTLIRRNILPTSDDTCTSKTCRLKHDKKLNRKITLECFDENGNVVVRKETFDSDEACLKRFWEITPLEAKKSNPENVDTIEICLDLSHLYPTKQMEEEFNLVIVDTPGCNSSKRKGEDIDTKQDIKIALDAINNGEKEMVVICADAQDYEDESLGMFLRTISEEVQDKNDRGDFNDRFLFVLNKCDLLKYNEQESVVKRKENFAQYLMDTKRWGIKEKADSPAFVPKILMVCAYIEFAVQMGVVNFTEDELKKDKLKKNLFQEYRRFSENVLVYDDENYKLAAVCDVPEYLKKDLQGKFESYLRENNKSEAAALQSGMDCIESSIKDYIARYAIPFKVRDLMDTFDALLQAVRSLTEFEDEKLEKRIENLGKGMSEREEVEKEKREEERKKEKLNLLEKKVEEQKKKINEIYFSEKKFLKIREDMEVAIEAEPDVRKVRNINNQFSRDEISELVTSVDEIFSRAWNIAADRFDTLTGEYKQKLEEICQGLKAIAEELQNGDDYDFNGFRFRDSLGVEKINRLDANSLRKQVEATRETVVEGKTIKVRNPVKDEKYKWWQFGKKIKKLFASKTINKYIEEKKEVYSAEPLQKYLTDILAEFRDLSEETARNYSDDINLIKKQALKMADDIPEDIRATTERISKFMEKINSYGNDIEALEQQMAVIRQRREFLQSLIDDIKVGGGYYV